MEPSSHITLFGNRQVRRIFHDDQWWFAITDVVAIFTGSTDAGQYLKRLRQRDKSLADAFIGGVHFVPPLALPFVTSGGKQKLQCWTVPGILRLIQAIPSAHAEPFKQWLARVGSERMQELADPALALDRARDTWKKQGRSEKWIGQRMNGQETRNKLTDYWADHEVQPGKDFAVVTHIIHQEWTGLKTKAHKELKGLKSQNLRDHMNEAELIFAALAELSTRQIAETIAATGLVENARSARTGGSIARKARQELESRTRKSVVDETNFLPPVAGPKALPRKLSQKKEK